MGFDGGGEVLKDVTILQATGFDGSEHPLHEATAAGALGSKGQLAPDDGMAKDTLSGVVGGFNVLLIDERPEPFAMVVKFIAHAHEAIVAGEDATQ